MTVSEAARQLSARIVTAAAAAGRIEVRGGYASDLLSDVMGNSRDGDLWVTLQKHVNIVAVAQLNNLAGIVLVNGREPEPPTADRAEAEGIPIITTDLPAFEVAGILYHLGVRGRRES
jgi:hypothetical protein